MIATASIRPVDRTDLPGLCALIDAVELFPSELLPDMISGHLDRKDASAIWLTQDDGGQPLSIAYCAAEPMTDGTWNVLLIAVHPEAQHRGLGTALMERIEGDLQEQGQRVLIVETSGLDSFANARRFYRALGYDLEACIREYYAKDEDKIVFRKDLRRAA